MTYKNNESTKYKEKLKENNKLEENDSNIEEEKKMTKTIKRVNKTSKHYNILLSERIKIKDLPTIKIKQIETKFKKNNYLPFYKSSGTSVITSTKPKDFMDFYIKKSEFKHYMPENFFKFKKEKSVKKKVEKK